MCKGQFTIFYFVSNNKRLIIFVQGLGWDEFNTPWSKKGALYGVDYLKEHLCNIIRQSSGRPIKTPETSLPERKYTPVLGMLSSDIRIQNEEQKYAKVEHEDRSKLMRTQQLDDVTRDEIKLKNNGPAPDLMPGMVTRVKLKSSNNTLQWKMVQQTR